MIRRSGKQSLISLDILTEPFIDWEPYREGEALRDIDIFSPSVVELEALWPGQPLEVVIERISGYGPRWVAIKMDVRGSLVFDAATGARHHVPIFPAEAIDETGAGDAYSGGFIEGIVETGDVLEAGLRATVSASFAVEGWGAFGMLSVTPDHALERLRWIRNSIA